MRRKGRPSKEQNTLPSRRPISISLREINPQRLKKEKGEKGVNYDFESQTLGRGKVGNMSSEEVGGMGSRKNQKLSIGPGVSRKK